LAGMDGLSIYKVTPAFNGKYRFLRTRNSQDITSTSNVEYKVLKSLFPEAEYQVDEKRSTKAWFRVVSVRNLEGERLGGEGWVVKQWEGVSTLMPRPLLLARPRHVAEAVAEEPKVAVVVNEELRAIAVKKVHVARVEGRGGLLNPDWLAGQMANPGNDRLACDCGVAAWKEIFDGQQETIGMHVRICKRQGITAKAGHGLEVVHAMHAAMWGHCDDWPKMLDGAGVAAMNYSKKADVLVVFLTAIDRAERAHTNHGYSFVCPEQKKDGMKVMYFQESRGGNRALSDEEVLYLFKTYYY